MRYEFGVNKAAEDMVEDGGGVGVPRVATRRVEKSECGVRVLLGFEEFEKFLWRERFGESHHGRE